MFKFNIFKKSTNGAAWHSSNGKMFHRTHPATSTNETS